jgi:hypothetical protein
MVETTNQIVYFVDSVHKIFVFPSTGGATFTDIVKSLVSG